MANLCLMIGLPASGKSTFCKQITKKHAYTDAYISRDEIRYSMLDDKDKYFAKENHVFKEYISRIKTCLSKGYNVYADATHLNIASRRKVIEQIKRSGIQCSIIGIWIDTPIKDCLYRNNLREGRAKVPYEAMMDMYNKFQVPSYSEGFNTIIRVEGDNHYILEPEK